MSKVINGTRLWVYTYPLVKKKKKKKYFVAKAVVLVSQRRYDLFISSFFFLITRMICEPNSLRKLVLWRFLCSFFPFSFLFFFLIYFNRERLSYCERIDEEFLKQIIVILGFVQFVVYRSFYPSFWCYSLSFALSTLVQFTKGRKLTNLYFSSLFFSFPLIYERIRLFFLSYRACIYHSFRFVLFHFISYDSREIAYTQKYTRKRKYEIIRRIAIVVVDNEIF